MGSGRGDRNQTTNAFAERWVAHSLQWGPVVVTGISVGLSLGVGELPHASMGSGRGDRNQAISVMILLV